MTAAPDRQTHAPQSPRRPGDAPPVRVAYIDHTARMGGGEIALLNLVAHIDRAAVTPIVILFSEGPLADALRKAGIETSVMPLGGKVLDARKGSMGARSLLKAGAMFAALRHARRLARELRRLKIDIVHTNSLKADIIGGLAGRLARRRVIWHVRDRIADDYLPAAAARVFRRLCRIIPHYVVTNSSATLATLQLPATKRSAVVPSGVRPFAQIVHDGTDAEEPAPGANGPVPVVGIVGRIAAWKGQHIFLRAAAQVHARSPETRFKIVGSPLFGEQDYEREIHDLAASLGLAEFVDFAGFTHDVPAAMRSMTVVVHASTTGEPFGQVVIEAMAAARPVVATNGGGIPEIVEDGRTGFLVPMGDPDAMAAAILRLLEDPVAAAAMGQCGRQRVLDHFTIEHTARKVEAVYQQIAEEKKRT